MAFEWQSDVVGMWKIRGVVLAQVLEVQVACYVILMAFVHSNDPMQIPLSFAMS